MSEVWFHPNLASRNAAEAVLSQYIEEEGIFLVRKSASANGDFVLSVVHKKEIIHYQIRRRGQEALFSLSHEDKVIHGLDELIHYYCNNDDSGLQHKLGKYVDGDVCPIEVRLHGRENLLHRAAAEGNQVVVQELLKCGDRNMDAKNHDGQTAVHLASFFGHSSILRSLIDHGAQINTTDSSGYTPLHFAAQAKNDDAISVLLIHGKANPVIRNQITGWIPLHEAAWKGSLSCVAALVEGGSPLRPRTPKNETPEDLARANGYVELAKYLEEKDEDISVAFESIIPCNLNREKTCELLSQAELKDGAYLIRKSRKGPNIFVLSLLFEKKTFHFEIVRQGVYYFMEQGPYMKSLMHLVHHYNLYADGLPCKLLHNLSPNLPPRVPVRERMPSYPTNLRSLTTSTYENNESLRRVRHSKDNIPKESIHLGGIIGEGEFGSVHEGIYLNEKGEEKSVAIKVLHALDNGQTDEFIKEAELMMKMDHQCVVHLIGLTRGTIMMMILEMVPLGSLLSFLHEHPSSIQPHLEIPLWAAQISNGMVYLESNKFIHRDLAARNILLSSKFQAKISDFGLSRHIEEKNYYRATKGGRWPIKWYAPECINFGTFSSKSDVWSFGVLLWEMYTFGKQPFENMTGSETVSFIESGQRLPRPERAELEVYSAMLWCWEQESENRPNFKELFKIFAENPEYQNMQELLRIQDLQQLGM